MSVPKLTHLQFLVIGVLLRGDCSGRVVRSELEAFGIRKSGPAFYQLMARLEDAGWLEGRYEQEVVEGQIIRERIYTLRPPGLEAWNASRDFYAKAIADLGGLGDLAGA